MIFRLLTPGIRLVLGRLAVALAAVIFLAGLGAVLFPQQMLTIDSGDVKGDALVVLGGGSIERPQRAAELFEAGAAPRVLVSGMGDCGLNVRVLEKDGVPAADITREDRSTSTLENAKFSLPLLRQMGAHRVILVTTWYHSRRALACFEHFAPDITFYSRPSYLGYAGGQTNHQPVDSYAEAEFVKLPGYWIWYGVRPW